ncbi:MAG: toxin-antitoxin system YwqK family antitoxin [Bacteroidota bacterium]
MKTLILSILLMTANILFAQVTVSKAYYDNGNIKNETPYVNGKLEGANTAYFENGKISAIETYINGIKEGKVVFYYENGNMKTVGQYENGLLSGVYKSYYQTGELSCTSTFIKGKREGAYECYFANGKVSEKGTYVNNEADGIVTVYNESGALVKNVTYVKGKKIDDTNSKKEYYGNGKLKKESPLINGKIEGKEKEYYDTGELFSIVDYKNGKKNGEYECYFKTGKIQQKSIYKDDKFNGWLKTYYANGNIKNESLNIDGKYEGYVTEYYYDGTVSSKKYYKGGKKILGDLNNRLDLCEGVDFFIKLLKNKKFTELEDDNWIDKNFGGIEGFRYLYFMKASDNFISDDNECALEYLLDETNITTLNNKYETIKSLLSKCKFLKAGKEVELKYTKVTSRSIDYKYNDLISLTLMLETKGKITIIMYAKEKL